MIGDAQVPGEVDDRLCHRVNAISLYEEGNNQNGGRKGENPKARDRGNDRGSSDAAGQKKSAIQISYQPQKMNTCMSVGEGVRGHGLDNKVDR